MSMVACLLFTRILMGGHYQVRNTNYTLPPLSPDCLDHLVTLRGCPARPVPQDHGPRPRHVTRAQETSDHGQCQQRHHVRVMEDHLSLLCIVLSLRVRDFILYADKNRRKLGKKK